MKNGFTLVELLAVLIILAIISLILTPVISDVIDDSKKNSVRISTEHYIDAINAEISNQELIGQYESLDGTYIISSDGKILTNGDIVLNIDYKGDTIKEGSIEVESSIVVQLNNVIINEWTVKIESGKVVVSDN